MRYNDIGQKNQGVNFFFNGINFYTCINEGNEIVFKIRDS